MKKAALYLLGSFTAVGAYMPTAYIDIRRTHSNLNGEVHFVIVDVYVFFVW